jgi:hypothetical protein
MGTEPWEGDARLFAASAGAAAEANEPMGVEPCRAERLPGGVDEPNQQTEMALVRHRRAVTSRTYHQPTIRKACHQPRTWIGCYVASDAAR